MNRRRLLAACAAAVIPSRAAWSQAPEAAAMQTELVTTGLYLIRGGGANALLRLSGNGTVLVDAKSPGNERALLSQVRKISRLSDMPLRAVLLTSSGADHAGNATALEAAGIGLVAQQNTLRRIPVAPASTGRPAATRLGYDDERELRLGGVEIRLRHFGAARSDGDSVVQFPDLKVVAVGDLCTPEGPPEPDDAAGGSLAGWSAVLGKLLQLDFEQVVPGSGPVMRRRDLEAYRSRLDALLAQADQWVRQGVAGDELATRLASADPGWALRLSRPQAERLRTALSRPSVD